MCFQLLSNNAYVVAVNEYIAVLFERHCVVGVKVVQSGFLFLRGVILSHFPRSMHLCDFSERGVWKRRLGRGVWEMASGYEISNRGLGSSAQSVTMHTRVFCVDLGYF